MQNKNKYIDLWNKCVLGKEITISSNQQIKSWLSSSLISVMEEVTREYGLEFNEELIKKIKNSKDIKNKSKLERDYIYDVYHEIINLFENQLNRDSWSGWPVSIRKTNGINCLGVSIIANIFFDHAGIKNYYGNPSGHVLNVIQLSDGSWIYFDTINDAICNFEPIIKEIEQCKLMAVNHPSIIYQWMAIFENDDVASFVLSDFLACCLNGNEKTIKLEDVKIVEEMEKIYSQRIEAWKNKILVNESNRISLILKFFDELGSELNLRFGNQNILKEYLINKKNAKNYLIGKGVRENLPLNLQLYLDFIKVNCLNFGFQLTKDNPVLFELEKRFLS